MKKKIKISWWNIWLIYVFISSVLELATDNFGQGNPSYFWCLLFIISDTVTLIHYFYKKCIHTRKHKNRDYI